MENPLQDQLHRPLRDLRISVTDRCNFRCTYCMPIEKYGEDYPFLPKSELLSFEEIERLVRIFVTFGVKKIRLTGGEPLLRRGLGGLIRQLRGVDGVEDIAMTTNGLLLHQYSEELYEAGLRRLNISLDALDPGIFGTMNGRGIRPERILENIDFAGKLGYEIKVNMVVQKGMNDREIIPMAEYFKDRNITLRLIEYMDVGNDNGWSFGKVTPKAEMLRMLGEAYDLKPVEPSYFGEVAKYYRYSGSTAKLGFITSVSESFCSSCTRARLSSEGKLFTCLFASEGFDLRKLLREGIDNADLTAAIRAVWEKRTDRYSDERTEFTARNRKKIGMSYIGG